MTQCRYSDVSAQHRHDRSTQLLNMQEEASSHVSARRRSDPVPEQFEKRVCMDKLVFVFGYCKPASAGVTRFLRWAWVQKGTSAEFCSSSGDFT
ncbi:hypothetical protein PVAP13_9NG798200 [Panicum virgatum]|uniref:Uncharacterized protein n=1 Tax=Panicum virgatum TaxID=38727 RepID=A0A8T0N3R6_PANVG|nr:hypothetical protein PVAP13_9NG798200 [Panicum virgatum]